MISPVELVSPLYVRIGISVDLGGIKRASPERRVSTQCSASSSFLLQFSLFRLSSEIIPVRSPFLFNQIMCILGFSGRPEFGQEQQGQWKGQEGVTGGFGGFPGQGQEGVTGGFGGFPGGQGQQGQWKGQEGVTGSFGGFPRGQEQTGQTGSFPWSGQMGQGGQQGGFPGQV